MSDIQTRLNAGEHVILPAGETVLSETLHFRKGSGRLSGAGMYTSTLKSSADPIIRITGETTGTKNMTANHISDLGIVGNGSQVGVFGGIAPYTTLTDVLVTNCGTGIELYNADFLQMDRCHIRWNNRGIYGAAWYPDPPSGFETRPNHWRIRDCSIAINHHYGLWVDEPSSLLLDGCDIANNGMSSQGERWGVRLNKGTPEGGGTTIRNCYIESNYGVADIWYQFDKDHRVWAGMHNLENNSFNRAAHFGYDYATCNVLVQFKNNNHRLKATGNTFKYYKPYEESGQRGHYTIKYDATNGNQPANNMNFIAFANHQQIAPGDTGFNDRF